MTASEVLSELRIALDDTVSPYGWSDALLMAFIDEAQDMFCEDTGLFTDASTYKIEIETGKASYPIDPRIIEIMDVWDDTGALLTQRSVRDMHSTAFLVTDQGTPAIWCPDFIPGSITLYPVPSLFGTIRMKVWRYAVLPPSVAVGGAIEIPARFHRALIEYAAYKAFGIHDKEYEDQKQSRVHNSNYAQMALEGKRYVNRISNVVVEGGCAPFYRV